MRPPLVIGFAAETENLIDNAKAKLARKGCDWIVANDVSPASGVMGGDRNTVHLLTQHSSGVDAGIKVESWPVMTKEQVATALIARIAKPRWRDHRERRCPSRDPAIAARRRPALCRPIRARDAAGLDLLAAVPEIRPSFCCPENMRWCPPA